MFLIVTRTVNATTKQSKDCWKKCRFLGHGETERNGDEGRKERKGKERKGKEDGSERVKVRERGERTTTGNHPSHHHSDHQNQKKRVLCLCLR